MAFLNGIPVRLEPVGPATAEEAAEPEPASAVAEAAQLLER
jgi:hypothetical protein